MQELRKFSGRQTKEEQIFKGFLPRIHAERLSPESIYRSYFQTYVERDVYQLMKVNSKAKLEEFVKKLAGRIGQPLNLSSLSDDLGVSSTTLNEWFKILEASFIVFRLPPYFNNFGKRLIKSPKLYFTEVGLACWLLGIEEPKQVLRDPLLKGLFENMIVLEALKSRYNRGKVSNLYFWKDNNGNEIDLLVESRRELIPIQIKSASTWAPNFALQLHRFQKTIPVARKGLVIYGGEESLQFDSFDLLPFDARLEL